ncbi:GCN5-related N-acetyltransferase 7, chloroplastic isoform X2 [Ziziphus jujuba]|uniref:GCN5-related N-acetyltransferase 7, chloroplastic isoform X2 n=1 Tax=Ziziphus jujuba TaxID=326968 RepID=A0A6P3ZUA3_ZIZJJ|nr:GCN5-related N-acetyltransferase 7, chloroplastic isoform X2 [Ziziphus jujuba]
MALVSSPPCSPRPPPNRSFYSTAMATQSSSFAGSLRRPIRHCRLPITASHLCTHSHTFPSTFDRSLVTIDEAFSDDQLWAAACLRVRSFYHFQPNSFGVQDHKRYLAEREFEALKERVAGKRTGFRRVSCINATVPLSHTSKLSDELSAECKGIGADFARAYLSNVCVAAELQRNGLGYALIAKSKSVAQEWGISDLYVHVAIDNEPAKNLYMKSGFIYENDEPAWQARFLDRPRRILLWTGLPGVQL